MYKYVQPQQLLKEACLAQDLQAVPAQEPSPPKPKAVPTIKDVMGLSLPRIGTYNDLNPKAGFPCALCI